MTVHFIGAGPGGLAAAMLLAAQGARVHAFDLASAIEQAPQVDGVTYVATDVTDEEQVRSAVAQASADPAAPLRIVVNCAGIGPSARILGKKGPHDLTLYAKVVQVNLVGSFNVLTLAAEKISQTEALEHGARGIIINTASIAAYDGQVGQAAYSSSKGGIVGLTLPAARDLAQYGIRVMTIAPGIFETPMLMGMPEEVRDALGKMVPFPPRLGMPKEYAHLAKAIIENVMLNGETIRLDGAIRMQPK